METSKITNEVFTYTKKKVVPQLILKICLLTITAIAYTVFVIHCLYTDLTFSAEPRELTNDILLNRYSDDITTLNNPNRPLLLYGIAFYVVYLIVMFVIIKNIIKSVNTLRHFQLNDLNAVNLVTDDFQDGFSGKSSTVANAMFGSNPARVYMDTFLKFKE